MSMFMSIWLALGVAAGAVSAHTPVLEALSTGHGGAWFRRSTKMGLATSRGGRAASAPGGWLDSDMVGPMDHVVRWTLVQHLQNDVVPIATGAVGAAISDDGLVWERACGLCAAGECLRSGRATARRGLTRL